jgi:pentatricopeptide repeat protein
MLSLGLGLRSQLIMLTFIFSGWKAVYQQGYNGVISSCEKASEWMLALDLLGEMSAVRIEQSVITYSAAVSACEKGCLCQSSQRLFGDVSTPAWRSL